MRIRFIPAGILLILTMAACQYTQKIKDGRTAYERKQFFVAASMLEKEYKKADTRLEKGKLAFLLGESYKAINKSPQAIQWYRTAYDNQYGVDALKEYAFALKRAERYEEAMQAFKELGIEIGSPYEYRREISACEIAAGWKKIKQPDYVVELSAFNSGKADYSPSLYRDNQLVITSDRQGSTGEETYNWTGNDFSDLYLVNLTTNDVFPFDEALNTANNEGTVAFANNFAEAYFTRCFNGDKRQDAYCKLMVSEWMGSGWSPAKPLSFVEENINYGHPSLSKDGKKLYFSCNHPDGWGGFDIYMSERQSGGEWGAPQLLNRNINTPGNERFPVIDGDTLYFSSDHHPGMGGLDIFKTYKLSNGAWAPVFNLKPPINSGGDDFGFVVDYQSPRKNGVLQQGYLTSTRENGAGNDDIYRFEKRIPPPVIEPPVKKDIAYKMILDGYVLEKIHEAAGDPNSRVLGRKPLPESTVEIRVGKELKSVKVNEEGYFTLELAEEADYDFVAARAGYLSNKAAFSTRGLGKDPENPVMRYELEIVLDRIYLDKEIRLENIYYDFDKWDIREDAQPTLNALAENLQLNPAIRIQLSSHTDCRGNDRYNEDLSQKRAQSAVDYLISKGIDPTRLAAKGYGETIPEVDCLCTRCTEDEHQANRRTTFKIIE
jgi:outer membrane protein OmpA-like peptidoglycan-associated protein/tetratricopeptide (TPR) repeat protein